MILWIRVDFHLSTALHHAFGFVSSKYINFGNRPSYVEETSEIYRQFYITPAKPESINEYMRKILGVQRTTGKPEPLPYLGGHSTSQWNARPHQYAVKNWSAKEMPKDLKGKNLPKFGKERVLDQQNLLTSYILPYEIEALHWLQRFQDTFVWERNDPKHESEQESSKA